MQVVEDIFVELLVTVDDQTELDFLHSLTARKSYYDDCTENGYRGLHIDFFLLIGQIVGR